LHIVADLHTHSSISDGNLSPLELVALAASKGLTALALTDHDTLAGLHLALRSAESCTLRIIPGVEISAEYEPGMLHVLGYFPSYPQGLESALEQVQRARRERIPRIITRLNNIGMPITEAEVLQGARGAMAGRPHIARILVKKGYVKTYDEAFDGYLGTGKAAYVPKVKLTWEKTIHLIREHGGLPVLAHPYTLGLERGDLLSFTARLCAAGLAGIEVHYPEHTPDQISLYSDIASELNLVITGGSDFHGPERNSCMPGDFGIDAGLLDLFCKHLMT